jgi:23S rRNA (adenine2503-C2)-methyltransferase
MQYRSTFAVGGRLRGLTPYPMRLRRFLSSFVNFYEVSESELVAAMKRWGQPAFRAKQIRKFVYDQGITDFKMMHTLPKELRYLLESKYNVGVLQLASEQVSAKDGTRKRAYELPDRQLIESVLMPYEDGRYTACISSQAGCAMGCVFCATGQMGFFRQLSAAEIFEQAQIFSAELLAEERKGVTEMPGASGSATGTHRPRRLTNVVLMGMGEPLANFKNVMAAVRRMNTELGIGARHITISTSGVVPRIRTLADTGLQVGLAVSLHQTTNEARTALMPINAKYPIGELLEACRYYTDKTGRRITFEWALIQGETDSIQTAHKLGQLLKGILCHVNVIPLNQTTDYGGVPTSRKGVEPFCAVVASYGISATARQRRGLDINAGCGQLRSELVKRREGAKPQ